MLPLAHVILHVGFCSAIARQPEATQIPVRVRLTDRIGRVAVDRTYRVERGDEGQGIVEFDSAFGIWRLDVGAPKYGCTAQDYLFFISGHDRSITEALAPASSSPPTTPMLLSGEAPQSFLYVQPTFVLFDKSLAVCNKPIPEQLPAQITVENDQDAYYAWLYHDPSTGWAPQQLALRLRTPTHQYHYVRVPVPFPLPWTGWPQSIQFNVTEEMVDSLAGDPIGTLLCPKLWKTSAG
jgi:hypothetical protein